MEYVQERVTTLHDFHGHVPTIPLNNTAVIVPLTEHDYASAASTRVFEVLSTLDVELVVVALRSPANRVGAIQTWLDGFDLPLTLLWCNDPSVEAILDNAGLCGDAGKGRDVWLALGVAADAAEYVAVHDADATTYDDTHVQRLVWPLQQDFEFSKGYYARVENDRLYGRLFRLFYAPLVQALASTNDEPILDYLGSFRYALAGEFAVTADLARRLSVPRGWGLEVGTLGDAFEHAGFRGTAQVDLGVHEHDHRSVRGPGGLAGMSDDVGETLFSVVERHGVRPEYDVLSEHYRAAGSMLVDQYAADAAFNGLSFDRTAELEQVAVYADSIHPPENAPTLPAWVDAPISPADLRFVADGKVGERN